MDESQLCDVSDRKPWSLTFLTKKADEIIESLKIIADALDRHQPEEDAADDAASDDVEVPYLDWLLSLHGGLTSTFVKSGRSKSATPVEGTLSESMVSMIDMYADLLMHPLYEDVRDSFEDGLFDALILHPNFESSIAVKREFCMQLLLKTSTKGKLLTFQKKLYANRQHFASFALRGVSDRDVQLCKRGRQMLQQLYLDPNLHSEEGRRFLCQVCLLLDITFLTAVFRMMENVLENPAPSSSRTSLADKTDIYSALGLVLFQTWTLCDKEDLKICIENFIDTSTKNALRYDAPIHRRYMSFLHSFHTRKDNEVRDLICARLPPLLSSYLYVANHKVRINAIELFCKAFPLVDATLPSREYELEFNKNLKLLLRFPEDRNGAVRAAAVSNIMSLLRAEWLIIPADVIAQLFQIFLEKNARDVSTPACREAVVTGVTVLFAVAGAQESMKQMAPQLGPLLHDNNASVRLSIAKLLLVASHVPDYHFLRICSLKDICARLIKDAIIVDVEEKCKGGEAPAASKASIHYQICETLGALLSASIYDKADVLEQVEAVAHLATRAAAVVPRVVQFSTSRLKMRDRYRLSVSLFRAAYKALGVRQVGDLQSAVDTVQLPDVVVSTTMMVASVELFRSLSITCKPSEKTAAGRKKKVVDTQDAASVDTLNWDDIKDKLTTHFDPDLLSLGLTMQCLQVPNDSSQAAHLLVVFGEAVCMIIEELTKLQVYEVPPSLRKTIISELQSQEYIGSPTWRRLLQLGDCCRLPHIAKHFAQWLEIVNQAHAAVLSAMTSKEAFTLDHEDVHTTLNFIRVVPSLMRFECWKDALKDGFEAFFDKFFKEAEQHIPQLAMTPEGDEKEIFYEHWSVILPVALAVILNSNSEHKLSRLSNGLLRMMQNMSVCDLAADADRLAKVVQSGSGSLGAGLNTRRAISKRVGLLRALLESFTACALVCSADTPLLQGEGDDPGETLYGLRNLAVTWMRYLCSLGSSDFSDEYEVWWQCHDRAFQALIRLHLPNPSDLLTAFGLVMTLSFVDMHITPETIIFPLPGIVEIVTQDDSEETHKKPRMNGERAVSNEQGKTYSGIAMPRNVSSSFHPHLPDAQALVKALVKALQLFGGEAGSSLTFVVESLATQFSNPAPVALSASTLTIPAPWVALLPLSTRELLSHIFISTAPDNKLADSRAPGGSASRPDQSISNIIKRRRSAVPIIESLAALESLDSSTGKTPLRSRLTA